MEWLTADCERNNFLAVTVKLPARASVRKARSWRLSSGEVVDEFISFTFQQ